MLDRTKGLGSSDAPAAAGLSRWKTQLSLYLEKIGQLTPTEPTNAMRIGTHLQNLVLDLFEETLLNAKLQRDVFVDGFDPWRWASLDGRIVRNDSVEIVEAKTTSDSWEWGVPGTDQIPQEYLIQTHHQLLVTGLQIVWVPVLFLDTKEFAVYKVERDDEFIRILDEEERQFWDAVQARKPPLATRKDLAYLKRVRTGLDGPTRDATPSEEEAKQIYFTAKEQLGKWGKQADAAMALLLEDMRQAEVSAFKFADGYSLRRKEVQRKEYSVAAQTVIHTRWIKPKH